MDAAAAARRWADTWERAWPAADVAAIACLYAADAVFFTHPFRERQTPTEYVKASRVGCDDKLTARY